MKVVRFYNAGADSVAVFLPEGAEPLGVSQLSFGFWALVDPDANEQSRELHLLSNDQEVPAGAVYIGTREEDGVTAVHFFLSPP